jgi:hypothetical protein
MTPILATMHYDLTYCLHITLYFLVVAQLVKAIESGPASVAHKWVEIWFIVVHSWLSLVHICNLATSNKVLSLQVLNSELGRNNNVQLAQAEQSMHLTLGRSLPYL